MSRTLRPVLTAGDRPEQLEHSPSVVVRLLRSEMPCAPASLQLLSSASATFYVLYFLFTQKTGVLCVLA